MEFSGPPAVDIPTEVCEGIIDMLYSNNASDTFEDIATLHTCSLVCRSWRVRAQRNLFYKVQLSDGISLHRLSTILDTGQHLRDYVHEVILVGHFLQTTASILTLFPVIFFEKLPNLERLDIGSLQESDTWWYPRPPDPPKTKSLPYVPLYARFSGFLSSFTGISQLLLYSTTFRSFSEFARIIHGLPNLKYLACSFVRWLAPGGSHPGADLTREPDWLPHGHTLPPFAPQICKLWFRSIATYAMDRLIRTRGPHLTWLSVSLPLSVNMEMPGYERDIDLSSCSGLRTLDFALTPEFSEDLAKSIGQLESILESWKPQRAKPFLELMPFGHSRFTREDFSDVLYALSPVIDTWLHDRTIEAQSLAGVPGEPSNGVQYQLSIEIHDWEAKRERWSDHINACFPTWLRLGRLHMDFGTPPNKQWEWKQDEEEQSLTPQVQSSQPEDE